MKVSPFSFTRTFALQNMGSFDPTATLTESYFSKVFETTDGACAVVIVAFAEGVGDILRRSRR